MRIVFAFLLVFLLSLACLQADTLTLKNGSVLQGTYLSGDQEAIRFTFNGTVMEYPRSEVQSLTIGEAAEADTSAAETTTETAQPAAPQPADVTLPAGTVLMVSLQSSLNSGSVKPGQSYPAALVSDVRVGERVAVPSGTPAEIKIVSAKSGGRGIRKQAELTFTVDALKLNGETVAVRTSVQKHTEKGEGGRRIIGGAAKGAALGAIVGAISGDAGDGAAAGAAAGSAGGFIRKGDDVEYPAGSVLAFTLASAVKF